MRVVLDTNVLLIALPKISPYRIIFDSLIQAKYTLVVTESIIQEYREIIGAKTNGLIATNLLELLMQLECVELANIHFTWGLIEADPDDNKFVDCAIACNASFIVTNDKHFKVLENIPFPSIECIDVEQFSQLLRTAF